jgi:catechol 2,3-dioxygenase
LQILPRRSAAKLRVTNLLRNDTSIGNDGVRAHSPTVPNEGSTVQIKSLGHVVVRVRDRARAEHFYGGVLGLPLCARYDEDGLKMAFFTLGNHHDFAVAEVSGAGSGKGPDAIGLDHVAFNIGTTLDELREAKARLEAAGIVPEPIDHEVTKSLYFEDPDGNGIELYVDTSDVWRREPQRVAQVHALEL